MAQIVVVDDRVTNRRIFSRLAASVEQGAVVEAFGGPLPALAWVERHAPDLVVTDYKMPGMDGAEFIRRLRASPGGADVPVIVITAYEDRAFRLQALEAGATDFLQSPVDHQEFVTRARNLLRLGQQQRVIRGRAEELARELAWSERRRENAIRDSRARLAQVIDTIPAAISAVDAEGRRVFVNEYGAALLPASGGAAPARDARDERVLRTGEPLPGHEEEITDRHDACRTFLTSKFPLRDAAGRVTGVLTTSFDISDRKRTERELEHLAHHDALTGLPNRLLLHATMAAALGRTEASGRGFALHFIDLDRFKGINDAFGHDHGDGLLREIADRLRRAMRPGDTVARLGGDEFAILQADVGGRDDAARLAARVIAAVSEPVAIEQRQVSVGASVGITLCPDDARAPEQLQKNADLAMYQAKHEGRGRFHFFAAGLQTRARASVLLGLDLRQGIERDEFVVCFQPQVDVASGRLVGAEALLRWRRPGQGLVSPDSFLPRAEETGLIVPITRRVLRSVGRQAAAWSARGTPVRVGVNISTAIFRTEGLLDLVQQALAETGLDPALLELELTESALMENQREVASDLHALRRLGVRVAIDDFGIGYSSLAYLRLLPIDRLKIDRSFVRDLGSDPGNTAIIRAVVGIGRSLGIEVLAEGVETPEQLRRVAAEGCQVVQGFHFHPALSADAFGAMLTPRPGLPVAV